MTEHLPFKLGISQTFSCSYLANENERLLVVLEDSFYTPNGFEHLLAMGFRRSGDQIYRPHCPSCNKCIAIRLDPNSINLSRSQKRLVNKTKSFTVRYSPFPKDEYFALYTRYINERHIDGAMYPANYEQYNSFLACAWLPITYLELHDNDKLIAVAVTDTLPNSLSAIYTFFDPDYADFSLGTLMVLKQVELAKKQNKSFIYLGYYIAECDKMNYKTRFLPHQKLLKHGWLEQI